MPNLGNRLPGSQQTSRVIRTDGRAEGNHHHTPQFHDCVRMVHKTANVLNKMPKSVQPRVKAELHEIWLAETRAEANRRRLILIFSEHTLDNCAPTSTTNKLLYCGSKISLLALCERTRHEINVNSS